MQLAISFVTDFIDVLVFNLYTYILYLSINCHLNVTKSIFSNFLP